MKLSLLVPASAAILVLAAFTYQKTGSATVCADCESLTGVEKIVCLANDFKASLSASQVTTLQLERTLTNAKQWSNLPVNFTPRLGIRFGDLNATQLEKAKLLLQEALGEELPEGYAEVEALWAADTYLAQNGGGNGYGAGQYYMAFLGEPSTTGAWELQSGGHHLAISNTYNADTLSGATPSFRAVEPFAAFTVNGNTYRPMIEERDSLAAVLASLNTTQLAAAKLSATFNDILLGPNKDWQFPAAKAGIRCNQLSAAQKNLVLAAIRTYVGDLDAAHAEAYMALYASQIDDTYIAYSNTAALSQTRDYIRIDGPRVWIEYSVQNGIVLSPTHPHSVWRDHQSDYGGLGNTSVSTSSAQAFTGKFELMPNPAAASTQLSIELPKPATVSLSLYDSTGKKLSGGFQFNMTAGQHSESLDVQHLPGGIYNCVLEVKGVDGGVAVASRKLGKM